jgi:2-amino-4-hydroxy-6-hydroxymethyldihydropteridine diphosphokinase
MAVVTNSESGFSHIAYIAVGSNIGDKKRNCLDGLDRLAETGQADIVTVSEFYKTEPVDYVDQDWFVNAVAKISTRLDPFDLLKALMAAETALGRRRDGVRFGPRIIDLDIIFYDRQVIDSPQLVIPHPRMHKRRFVLAPICDIEPELLHPVLNTTMRQLLGDLDVSGQDLVRLDSDA